MSTPVSFKTIIMAVTLSVALSVSAVLLLSRKSEEVIVVDAIKLFNGFKMKIEMEEAAAVQLKAMSSVCDSLGNIMKVYQSNRQEPDPRIAAQYRDAIAAFQAEYDHTNKEINEQVWKRLNPIIAEFGKERKSAVVIGANGMGTVLYNDPDYDKTDEAIVFVNRYYDNKQ
ncbi:MAG TPA: hypothetical protein VL092_08205 [Chitinophagaceae bacterium]|nr:hypothetical protein [Chitinophagaceae bacterium]